MRLTTLMAALLASALLIGCGEEDTAAEDTAEASARAPAQGQDGAATV